MNMVDHLSIGVSSIREGVEFYSGLLKTLECELMVTEDSFAVYGKGRPQFILMIPYNREPCSAGNGVHIAFIAPSLQAVNDFYSYACSKGDFGEGKPTERMAYPKLNVFNAYVRDPFGNSLEAIYEGYSV